MIISSNSRSTRDKSLVAFTNYLNIYLSIFTFLTFAILATFQAPDETFTIILFTFWLLAVTSMKIIETWFLMVKCHNTILGHIQHLVTRVIMTLTAYTIFVALHTPTETTTIKFDAPSLLTVTWMFLTTNPYE